MSQDCKQQRGDIYQEITNKIISQIEGGVLPWVQPWQGGGLSLPRNASTQKAYSGINILLLWDALFSGNYATNKWLTFKQALAMGGAVRKGERGTTVVFTDTFIPKKEQDKTNTEDQRRIGFLKRFTVFNVAQCDNLPAELIVSLPPASHHFPVESAESLIKASGAVFERGGDHAFYHPASDTIRVPQQEQFYEPINFYRTALHELTHWSGAKHRLSRDFSGRFGDEAYAREELVAEMGSAFLCANLGIVPTVRHADYIGNWLTILKNDSRAVVSAASHASKASDFLLAFANSATAEQAA
jgi:antirestriction protein ArdC